MQHTRGLLVTMLRMIKDLKVSIVIWDNGFCDTIKVPSLDTLIKVSVGRFCKLFSERSIRFILLILTKARRSMRVSLLFLMIVFCKILRLLKQNFWSLVIFITSQIYGKKIVPMPHSFTNFLQSSLYENEVHYESAFQKNETVEL